MSDVPILTWKISMSDTDVYRCEFWFIFCTVYVCFVLFPIKCCDVTCDCLVCRTFDHHNNEYTFSHWQPAACQGLAAMHYGCGQWAVQLLECMPHITITYRHIDTTDFPMFSLAPILLGMWRSSSSNSTTFELRTFSTDSKFVECF